MQLQQLTDTAAAPKWNIIRIAADKAYEDHLACLRHPRPGPQVIPFRPLRRNTLLTEPGSNTKLSKGSVPIYGLTLAPAGASGYQLCPWRTRECEAACLGITAGRSRFSNVQQARIDKTRFLMEHPYEFFRRLYMDLQAAVRRHGSDGFAFRSNVLSDVAWSNIAPQIYSFSRFNYDYTKSFIRAMHSLDDHLERLTLSHSGHNWDDCVRFLRARGNVAVVFDIKRKSPMPAFYEGWRVIDGDISDLRFFDPRGVIVGLRAKGNIDTDSPFVVRL